MWVNSHYKYAKNTKAYTQESFLVSLSQSYSCLQNFSVLYILKSIHSTICKLIVFICFYLNITHTHTHTHTHVYGLPRRRQQQRTCLPMHETQEMQVQSKSRRSSGERNGHPLQYSCLENPMHRGAWQTAVQRVTTE